MIIHSVEMAQVSSNNRLQTLTQGLQAPII